MQHHFRWRVIAAVAFVCALVVPAQAQKTKAQLNSEIGASFPDNNSGAITPAILRNVAADTVNAILPTAPVVSGNVVVFDGTTGLLKDGGVGPGGNGTAPQRVGVTNGAITESHAANAVTFTLVTQSGGTPSVNDPVTFTFSNGIGGYNIRSVTSALSITVPAGGTLGILSSSAASRLAIVAADNAGTVALGVGNFPTPPDSNYISYNTVAVSGSSNATETIYTTAGLTGVYVQPVAYAIYNVTFGTPGNWTVAPSFLEMFTNIPASMNYDLTFRPEVSQYDVAIMRPKNPNRIMVFDLGVNGSPTISGEGFLGWFDACNADLIASPTAPTQCGRLGIGATDTIIGNYPYNGAASGGIKFMMGGGALAPFVQMLPINQMIVGTGADTPVFSNTMVLNAGGNTGLTLRNSTDHVEWFAIASDSTGAYTGTSTAHRLAWRTSNANRGGLSATGDLLWGSSFKLLVSQSAPSIQTGFCTSPTLTNASGTAAFEITIGTGCAASTGTLNMPTASTGWVCHIVNYTNPTGNAPAQTNTLLPSNVIFTNFSRTTGAATNWTAGDVLGFSCMPF